MQLQRMFLEMPEVSPEKYPVDIFRIPMLIISHTLSDRLQPEDMLETYYLEMLQMFLEMQAFWMDLSV